MVVFKGVEAKRTLKNDLEFRLLVGISKNFVDVVTKYVDPSTNSADSGSFFTSYCPKYQTDSPRAATNFEVTGLCAANAAPHSALLERQEPPA